MSRQINLFNPLFLRQEKHFSARTMVQALGLLAVGLGLFYGYALYQRAALKSQVAEVGRAHGAARDRFGRLSAELATDRDAQRVEQELKSAQQAVDARVAVLERLHSSEAEPAKGHSALLRAFARQSMDGLWLTAIRIEAGGRQLSVSGRALQPGLVPEYLRRLGREEVLRGRAFERLQITRQAVAAAEPGKAGMEFVEFALMSSGDAGTAEAEQPREADR